MDRRDRYLGGVLHSVLLQYFDGLFLNLTAKRLRIINTRHQDSNGFGPLGAIHRHGVGETGPALDSDIALIDDSPITRMGHVAKIGRFGDLYRRSGR